MLRALEILNRVRSSTTQGVFDEYRLSDEAGVNLEFLFKEFRVLQRLGWATISSGKPVSGSDFDRNVCTTRDGHLIAKTLPELPIKTPQSGKKISAQDMEWNKIFWPYCEAKFFKGFTLALGRYVARYGIWGGYRAPDIRPYTVGGSGVFSFLKASRDCPSEKAAELLKMFACAGLINVRGAQAETGFQSLGARSVITVTSAGKDFACAVEDAVPKRGIVSSTVLSLFQYIK